ncbi:MAG: ATP-binding protein [Candidatus Magasanikbacteria bacterium]|nr:ATP-binding protein [Candidatus Magasanikbacteria bacterium]
MTSKGMEGVENGTIINSLIENCFSQIISENSIGYNGLKTKLVEIMSEMGITVVSRIYPYYRDLEKFFGCSSGEYGRWPDSQSSFNVIVRSILIEWGDKKEDLLILGSNKAGKKAAEINTSIMVEGTLVPMVETFFCRFRETNLSVILELDSEERKLVVQVSGYLSNEFMTELTECVNRYLIEKIRGKEVSIELKEINVQHYNRDQLIYPKQTAKKIDDLIKCFQKWQSDNRVMNWGTMLIGKRGSGKTTIGGLLSSFRNEGTTFFYVPAGEIEDADDLRRIFQIAKLLSPVIIQIDEVDLISKDRRYGNSEKTSVLMEFLEGLEEHNKVFTILTSNNPQDIEGAIIHRAGRVSSIIEINDFSEAISDLLEHYLKQYELIYDKGEILSAVKETSSLNSLFTPDEIKVMCKKLYLLHEPGGKILKHEIVEVIKEFHASFHVKQSSYLEEDDE